MEEMTLADVKPGQKAIVEFREGGRGQRRLWDMGLFPGTVIDVVAAHPLSGPVIVRTGTTRIAIGRNMARTLRVRRIP